MFGHKINKSPRKPRFSPPGESRQAPRKPRKPRGVMAAKPRTCGVCKARAHGTAGKHRACPVTPRGTWA